MNTRAFVFTLVSLFIVPQLCAAAGGSSGGGGGLPQQQAARLTPEQRAVNSYDAGLKHRDKAARYEQKAVEEQNEKKLTKLQRRIDKEYNRAIDDFEKAIAYYSDIYQAHSSLGFALRKVGRYEESLQAYNEALRLNSSYGEAIEYRGEAYLGLNRLDDAKNAYMELFQSDRALADELMTAMIEWVAIRRDDSAGVETTVIQEFAAWVEQRNSLASFVYPADSLVRLRWTESHQESTR